MRSFHAASTLAFILCSVASVAACSSAQTDDLDFAGETEAAERWNFANDPAHVDDTFVYEADKLPLTGQVKTSPTPGDYWATYKDSINVRWDGEESLSPAEKWAKAFDRAETPNAISSNYGIKAQTRRKECTKSDDCSDQKDGSTCSIPRGETSGRCIPTWWGICHGWAPFAFSEPTPIKAVEKNGVTFYPGDLEGIMSLVYSSGLPTKFLSERCNTDKPGTGPDGRIEDGECRDMNPGSFHVVATNMLGLRQTGFVEDRTYDDEVWNQPVRGYKITNGTPEGQLVEITKSEAAALLGIDVKFESLFEKSALKKGEKKTGVYKATVAGEILFKVDGSGDADLYVKKGAVAEENANDCSSRGSGSNETCKVTLAAGEELNYTIVGYADDSTVIGSIGTKMAADDVKYTFNADAKRFYHVEMDFQYIHESRPAKESHVGVIDEYTSSDHYSYILETDENARIIGGEWLEASRTAHPDFVWWPSGKPSGRIANGLITYAEAAELNRQAAGLTEENPDNARVETKELLKDAKLSRSKFIAVGVPGGKKLTLTLSGTGNADLTVRLGKRPTDRVSDAKSEGPTADETITLTAPESGGTYMVRVKPIDGKATVTLTSAISN